VHHEENRGWFHCGRCGALFQAQPGESVQRVCSHCGRHPSVFGGTTVRVSRMPAAPFASASAASPERSSRRRGRKRPARDNKAGRWMVRILLAWFAFIGLIFWAGKVLWEGDVEVGAQTRSKDALLANTGVSEDMGLLQRSLNDACQTMANFLQARSPEERSQFIRRPLDTVGKMVRYYALNPDPGIRPEDISLKDRSVLHIGDVRAIATVWQVADGRVFDAVFFKEDGEWRLDWEHFTRYSDHPWVLFLNGDGPSEGEFRVLARERLALDRRGTNDIGIVAYAPRFGRTDEAGSESPEFLVKRDSEQGKLLVAAFRDLEQHHRPFGASPAKTDPDDLVRLRIRVRRETDADGSKRFVLKQVVAAHWLTVDDPGVVTEP